MENRWGSRKLSGIDVIVDYRPAGMVRGTICNYSLSGVYLQTDNPTDRVHTSVTLVFRVPDGLVTRIQRVRAQVVRQDNTGIGLMFTDIERHTLHLLFAIQQTRQMARIEANKAPSIRTDPAPAVKDTVGNSP